MGFLFGRKVWIGGLLFLLAAATASYFLRQETYFLNKNVRLISLRIFEYQELSRHRRCRYKMQFERDHYDIYLLATSPERKWEEVTGIRYEDAIETSRPGFALEIDRGKIVSYQPPQGARFLRPSIILSFFPLKDPSKQSGILFYRDGTWRALKRFYGTT
jgi:hypothetical protein